MSPDPLFILAPPRSFTSIVCGMIGQHPDLYGLPEVNLLVEDDVAALRRRHGMRPRMGHGLLRAIAELGQGLQGEAEVEVAQAWLDGNPEASTADIYRDLAAWAAPRRLVDKSPIYVLMDGALDRIHAAFPDARYLHMMRHPHATMRSMVGLRGYIRERGGLVLKDGEDQAIDADGFWLRPHARAKEFLDSIPSRQWVRMRGEDLMGAPDLYLPQVAEWLGVRTDAPAIKAMMRPETSAFARPGPANARFGNDPSFMEQPALRPWTPTTDRLSDPFPQGVAGTPSDALLHYARLFGYG